MSYCRFSDADVYVYTDCNEGLTCCGCSLDENWYYGDDYKALLAHLDLHRKGGDFVPDYVYEEITEDYKDK